MTFGVLPTVLGKRAFQQISPIAYRSAFLQFPTRHGVPGRHRNYATVDDDKKGDAVAASRESANSEVKRARGQSAQQEKAPQSSESAAQSDISSIPNSIEDAAVDWEHNPDLSISKFSELPSREFGYNQHIIINEEFKEALRQILWKFRAPIRYAFAYGSGVFPQQAAKSSGNASLHPSPPEAVSRMQAGNQKMIDFIFGVSYTQHWHSLNLQEHRDHYSGVGALGSYAVSKIQDSFGAGVFFNPYVTVNGTLIKYGVVNIDTLCKDLSEWNTLYLAGRLQKPVKILRDNPSVRLANQVNLISAVRTALLLLPESFTEKDLYSTIAGISYMGDPRMTIGGDDPRKVQNIVKHQIANFRRLYAPLIENLPNINFNDPVCADRSWFDDPEVNAKLTQNMDPVTRGHMVRRLPKAFREKLYFEYQSKFHIRGREFKQMLEQTQDEDPERIRKREGGPFEQRIAQDEEGGGLKLEVEQVIKKTIGWPAFTQSLKSVITAGVGRSWRYAQEKRQKAKAGQKGSDEDNKSVKQADEKNQKEKED